MPEKSWAIVCTAAILLASTQPRTWGEDAPKAAAPGTVELKLSPGSNVAALTVGSKAPPLDIASWINPPKGSPIPLTESFKPGNVYIVEFWATWCGPCVRSMPHIAALQKQYADKNVTFIGISDEELPTINAFLDQETQPTSPQDKPMTFRQLTSVYRLTSDPDQSSHRAYMEAAGQDGIPTAFLVGKDGVIEWYGLPTDLDPILEKVVNNTWDREAYKVKLAKDKQFEQLMEQVFNAVRQRKFDQAIQLLDEAIAQESDPSVVPQIKQLKLRVLLATRNEQAPQLAKEIIDAADDPDMLDGFAWTVFELHSRSAVQPELLELAVASSNKALELASTVDQKCGIRDTLAHLMASQGRLDEAIALQKAAVAEASPELGQRLQPYLEQLQTTTSDANNTEKPASPKKP